jgi:hypothetical protein
VEGCRWGAVPGLRCQGAGHLRVLLRARLQPPVGDFFRGLLYYYHLELVHLIPNSIIVVSTVIHFCEAYLGISPHFLVMEVFLLCEEH